LPGLLLGPPETAGLFFSGETRTKRSGRIV